MYKALQLSLLLSLSAGTLYSQTIPRRVANTGIDGDLYADTLRFGSIPGSPAGTDDWFRSGGTGEGIIDTTGAWRLRNFMSGGSTAARNIGFMRKSRYRLYTPVNGNLLIGATFGRDQVSVSGGGNPDSTSFTSLPGFGASKNGMNPRYWKSEPSSVPGNDDLVEAYTAFRRAGTTTSDSLWLLGTVIRIGVTGTSYFDFEYIQDTMKLNRTTGRFSYGPDTGHTAWIFDQTSGDATRIGDVVFSAAFGTAGLSSPELRIWCRYSDWRNYNTKFPLSPLKFLTPAAGGSFDGPSGTSTYSSRRDTFGYALVRFAGTGIVANMPNNTARTTAGPWGAKNGSNVVTSYWPTNSSLDFAVNLTALGVDPYNLFSDPCAPIYSSFMAKSRATASFTSDLKDLIGPLDLRVPDLFPVTARTDTITCRRPVVTLVGRSNAASEYFDPYWRWKSVSGSGFVAGVSTPTPIAADTVINDTAYVNQTGTYIISLAKFKGCAAEAFDTVVVRIDTSTTAFTFGITDSLCTGTSAFRAKVFTVSSFDTMLYTLTITGPGGYSTRNVLKDTVTVAGIYIATLRDKENGCGRVIPLNVRLFPGCTVSISGTVWDDGNGTFNNAIDGVVIQRPSTVALYAYLINNTTNAVVDSQYVMPNGTYSLTANAATSGLAVLLSTTLYGVGDIVTTSAIPSNWVHVGESFGTGNGAGTGFSATTGTAGADGRILVNTGTTGITGLDFAINLRPESDDKTAASQLNPGGTVQVAVPALTGTDLEDGTLPNNTTPNRNVVIETVPGNATLYYDSDGPGGNAPFVLAAGQYIANYQSSRLTVDPNFNGAGTVSFTYAWRDSAGFKDLTPATVTMPFTGLTVSGTVFHDPDGLSDAQVDGTGLAFTGTNRLTAYLVNGSNEVVDSTRINTANGTYLLENADANSSYTVRISTIQVAIGATAPSSTSPTNGWVLTGETFGSGNSAGSGIEVSLPNGLIAASTTTVNITGVNFGLEVPPYAKDKTYTLDPDSLNIMTMWRFQRAIYLFNSNYTLDTTVNSLSTARRPGGLSGYDPEDGRFNGQTGVIPTSMILIGLPDTTNALLSYFNGTTWINLWPNPQVGDPSYPYWDAANNRYELANFDSTQLRLYLKLAQQSSTSFQYAYRDAANIVGTTATYTISYTVPLPVSVLRFEAGLADGGRVTLGWTVADEQGVKSYHVIRRDPSGRTLKVLEVQAAASEGILAYKGNDNLKGLSSGVYEYQLFSTEMDGSTGALARAAVIHRGANELITVAPVPAVDELTISLPSEQFTGVTQVTVMDASGRFVKTLDLQPGLNVINVSDLTPGIYYLRMDNQEPNAVRFMIQR